MGRHFDDYSGFSSPKQHLCKNTQDSESPFFVQSIVTLRKNQLVFIYQHFIQT
jgi:hypothetical protein